MFSLADATLLRPLDIAHPEQLVAFSWASSYPHYQAYTKRTDVFQGVIAVGGAPRLSVSIDGVSELASTAFVSGNTFDVLGVTPAIGRTLQPADDIPNGPVVAVLGHDYWRTHFRARPDVVGRALSINGRPVTIVGVAGEGIPGTTLFANPAVYVPSDLVHAAANRTLLQSPSPDGAGFVWLTVIGRLKDGVALAQAESAMDALYAELQPASPVLKSGWCSTDDIAGAGEWRRVRPAVRAASRRRRVSDAADRVRQPGEPAAGESRRKAARDRCAMALGAGRRASFGRCSRKACCCQPSAVSSGWRLPPSRCVSSSGPAAGWSSDPGIGLEINRNALLLTGALSLITAFLFGAAPAWRAARTDVMVSLRNETRGASARSGLRSALVGAQVALSLVLLTGSGLFVRSLVQAMKVPLGFTTQGVALASVNLNLVRYDDARSGVLRHGTGPREGAAAGQERRVDVHHPDRWRHDVRSPSRGVSAARWRGDDLRRQPGRSRLLQRRRDSDRRRT